MAGLFSLGSKGLKKEGQWESAETLEQVCGWVSNKSFLVSFGEHLVSTLFASTWLD
jgi:hypothetical protein